MYFEKNAEIHAFLLPTENSLNCNFAAPCDCFTVDNHTKSHENHTKYIGGTKLLKKPALNQGLAFYLHILIYR